MNGAQYIVKAIEAEGIDTVFGYPGGAIMPVYDAVYDAQFKHILVRHEQAAAIAASGYARSTGKVGVCLATSGPGATNLLTGIADAYMDSVPIVCITGQVSSAVMGTDAFQEIDVLGMSMPVVKHSFLPKTTAELPWVLREAFHIARSGRPGPVLIDIPKDVTLGNLGSNVLPPKRVEPVTPPPITGVRAAVDLYRQSRRPLIYAGGGVAMADALEDFRSFVNKSQIPVVTTLKGLGLLPIDHPLNLGMLGMHGTKSANYAVQNCDLLIAVGVRFDDRATGKLQEFAPEAFVIHMDIDAGELGKLRPADVALQGNIRTGMRALSFPVSAASWRRRCMIDKMRHAHDYEYPGDGIYAPRLLRNLFRNTPHDTIVTCDVGQHQMWVAQHAGFASPAHHLTSGGLGTMGYGLPAAMGAQLAHPDATVVCVSGDGSIMMNIQELVTVRRLGLPIKVLLFDNSRLGLVRQWQELFFDKRFSEVELSDNPDFGDVFESFGIPSIRIDCAGEEQAAIDAICQQEGPLLIHAVIDPDTNVWPLVPPGKSNATMLEGVPS